MSSISSEEYLTEISLEKITMPVEELKKISSIISPSTKEFFQAYLEIMKSDQVEEMKNSQLFDHFKYQKHQTESPLCGKILYKGDKAFRCKQCMLEDNSIVCIECFNAGNHEGHNYEQIIVCGGCCDCGDDEKWEEKGFCMKHVPKDDKIMVDEKQLSTFCDEMKFAFFLMYQRYFAVHDKPEKKKQLELINCFGLQMIHFLKDFNTGSLISNQTTYEFLKCTLKEYPSIPNQEIKGIKILDLFWKLQKLSTMANLCVELFTGMFPIRAFKEDLFISYIQAFNRSEEFANSQFNHISCQIFTCHKMISKILDEGRMEPLVYKPKNEKNFQIIANNFVRFYYDIIYFSRLFNGTNIKFLKFQFSETNVCSLAGYQSLAQQDIEYSISYYGLEKIFLQNFTKILLVIKDEKELLLKMIEDTVRDIKNTKNIANPYISNYRIFIYLIIAYFDGQIQRAVDKDFLQKIGINIKKLQSEMERMIKFAFYVLKLYTLCLSNQQTTERYYTFYSFIFNRKQIILALDFVLIQFCFAVLQKYTNVSPSAFLEPFVEGIKSQLNEELKIETGSIYDRKKALGVLTAFIGLMSELSYNNFTLMTLKCELKLITSQEMKKFYGNFLASLQPFLVSDFKAVLNLYIKEDLPFFEEFIREKTEFKGKKIQLKKNEYQGFHLSHLRSKKSSKNMTNWIHDKFESIEFSSFPQTIGDGIFLGKYLFDHQVIQQIVKIADDYQMMLAKDTKAMNTDYPHFSLFLDELLTLNLLYKPQKLYSLFKKIVKNEPMKNLFSKHTQKLIFEAIEEKKDFVKEQPSPQKNSKVQELKKQKKAKMHQKQKLVLNEHKEMIDNDMEMEEKFEEMDCMICKTKTAKNSLAFLCFVEKSNLFMKKYFKSERQVFVISSCNHIIHPGCFNKIFGARDYTTCQFCKSTSNFLASFDNKTDIEEENAISCLDRFSAATAVIEANEEEFFQKKGIKKEEKKIQLTPFEKLLQSLSISLLYAVIVDPQFYLRQQLISHRCLVKSLTEKNKETKNLQKLIEEEEKQCPSDYWTAHKFIIQSILTFCAIEKIPGERWDKSNFEMVPENTQNDIFKIISQLQSEMFQQHSITEVIPKSSLQLNKLPQKLTYLAKEIGKCPHCGHITNEIARCIICSFKSCMGCQRASLRSHAFKDHCGSSVFVRVDSGSLIYIGCKKVWVFESVYKNYLEEAYDSSSNKEKYFLDIQSEKKMQRNIVRHRIQQEIRYMQLTKHKTCMINP